MTWYVGIDPGLTGAIAGVDDAGLVIADDMPTLRVGKKKELALGFLREILMGLSDAFVGLEKVHSMPEQGIASAFNFGRSFGQIEGALVGLAMGYEAITPQRWKNAMMDGMPKDKDASRQVALRLWPEHADKFKLKKHHGRADAALIAEYMRENTRMSVVTNVVLVYGLCGNEDDHRLLEEINYACGQGRVVHVEDRNLPDCWFCNGKTLEVNVAVGAFNGLDLYGWVAGIRKIDFEPYECDFVQLLVQDQESYGFGIVNVRTEGLFKPFKWEERG